MLEAEASHLYELAPRLNLKNNTEALNPQFYTLAKNDKNTLHVLKIMGNIELFRNIISEKMPALVAHIYRNINNDTHCKTMSLVHSAKQMTHIMSLSINQSINLFRYTQKAYSSQNHNSKSIHIMCNG